MCWVASKPGILCFAVWLKLRFSRLRAFDGAWERKSSNSRHDDTTQLMRESLLDGDGHECIEMAWGVIFNRVLYTILVPAIFRDCRQMKAQFKGIDCCVVNNIMCESGPNAQRRVHLPPQSDDDGNNGLFIRAAHCLPTLWVWNRKELPGVVWIDWQKRATIFAKLYKVLMFVNGCLWQLCRECCCIIGALDGGWGTRK